MNDHAKEKEERIKEFYRDLPFNYYSSLSKTLENLNPDIIEKSYPDLHALLVSGEINSTLEIGCGAGWLSNTIAKHYKIKMTAIDFTSKAIERAREVAASMNISDATFIESNLYDFTTDETFDLVVSIGCLPATRDPKLACEHIQQFIKPGKYLYLGLYHYYGRKVFLDLFNKILREEGEQAAFEKYARLDSLRASDPVHLKSWFRDQVLHPHENQQTLKEVVGWLEELQLRLKKTSINRFKDIDNIESLFELEKVYEQISYQANCVDERYFPGFFTVMAQK